MTNFVKNLQYITDFTITVTKSYDIARKAFKKELVSAARQGRFECTVILKDIFREKSGKFITECERRKKETINEIFFDAFCKDNGLARKWDKKNNSWTVYWAKKSLEVLEPQKTKMSELAEMIFWRYGKPEQGGENV